MTDTKILTNENFIDKVLYWFTWAFCICLMAGFWWVMWVILA